MLKKALFYFLSVVHKESEMFLFYILVLFFYTMPSVAFKKNTCSFSEDREALSVLQTCVWFPKQCAVVVADVASVAKQTLVSSFNNSNVWGIAKVDP